MPKFTDAKGSTLDASSSWHAALGRADGLLLYMRMPTTPSREKPYDIHERLLIFAWRWILDPLDTGSRSNFRVKRVPVHPVRRPTPGVLTQIYPSSSAFRTARVRSRTPSLDKMLDAWFLTVPSAVPSALAISRLL